MLNMIEVTDTSVQTIAQLVEALSEGSRKSPLTQACATLAASWASDAPGAISRQFGTNYELATTEIDGEVVFDEGALAETYPVHLTLSLSQYVRGSSIVRECERTVLALQGEDRAAYERAMGCHLIYVVQGLPYTAGTTGDPWSKLYPTDAEIERRIHRSTREGDRAATLRRGARIVRGRSPRQLPALGRDQALRTLGDRGARAAGVLLCVRGRDVAIDPARGCRARREQELAMTKQQREKEAASIEAFVNDTMTSRRPRGTDAGTTYVMIAALRAAAEMSPRSKDGSINERVARAMVQKAVQNFKGTRP